MIVIENLIKSYFSLPWLIDAGATVKFVFFLSVAMLLLLVSFFLITLVTLIFHQISASLRKKYHRSYTEWTIQHMLDPSYPEPSTDLLRGKYLREAILDLLLITKGIERLALFRIYRNKGFWEADQEEIHSIQWHKRIAALVRMDMWQVCLGLDKLSHLLLDENSQIRQIAVKNLSRTKEVSEALFLLDHLANHPLYFSTTYEAIFRLVRLHRQMVLDQLQNNSYQKLWGFIVRVCGESKILESVPYLISIIEKSEDSSLRESSIISLGQIGDPRAISILRLKVLSPIPKEKIAALKALFQLDQEFLKEIIGNISAENNIDVQSWSQFFKKKLA